MRIIAGEFRRRLLKSPPDGEITRPIPDRVKESLFGLLRGHCEGANVFDGFAGTGAIGLEAVSRGAKHCVMVEQHPAIAKLLQQNVRTLGVEDRCEIVTGDALGPGALARAPRPLTLAFLDPPYPLVREELGFKRVMAQMAKLVELLTDDGFAVLRLPTPLFYRPAGSPAEPAPEVVVRKKKADRHRRERQAWRHERDELLTEREVRRTPKPIDIKRIEELDEADLAPPAEPGLETPDPAALERPDRAPDIRADLTVVGAAGPETHVYHNMAVHLYMRQKRGA